MNPQITADVIEANEFPELSQRFNVMGVPKTVIKGVQELIGAQPEARLMAALRAALEVRLTSRYAAQVAVGRTSSNGLRLGPDLLQTFSAEALGRPDTA